MKLSLILITVALVRMSLVRVAALWIAVWMLLAAWAVAIGNDRIILKRESSWAIQRTAVRDCGPDVRWWNCPLEWSN